MQSVPCGQPRERISGQEVVHMLMIGAVDEAIWHFVGIFHIAEERGRMRIDYDRLKPVKTDPDPGAIEALDQGAPHPYQPLNYIPDIPYAPPSSTVPALASDPDGAFAQPAVKAAFFGQSSDGFGMGYQMAAPGGPAQLPEFPGFPEIRFHPPSDPEWTLPAPGSVAVVVIQHTRLSDDDQLNPEDMQGGVIEMRLIAERLEGLADQATQLGVALPVALPADEPAFRLIAESFRAAEAPDQTAAGAQIHIRHGDEVEGRYQDGAAVDARPDIDTLMPAYHREKAAEARSEAEAEAAAAAEAQLEEGPVSAGPSFATGAPAEEGPAHELVAGANMLVNQVAITSAAIAAPVIAVAAGIYSYNIISQTNVWSDMDSIMGGQSDASPTQALNHAGYASFSNPAPVYGTGDAAPQYWVTATLEGSLISMNWIEQFNLMSDSDIAAITLQADQTLMLMGENGALNQVSLYELGSSYDLIIIDGQIINLNAVLQTNVMLDDDVIMVSDGQGAMIRAGDNLLVNDASIVQVGGSEIAAPTQDIDSLLSSAAEGEVTLPQSVLDDPAFEGLEVVRVLHIKGDLVSANFVRQTNVLGDSDQIQIYRDELLASGGEVDVVTGSNVLVNAASIAEFGVDATIYSGGEVYSDALLYQAELVSTQDPLMPGPGAGLASEAVLFLAEGMLGDQGVDDVEFRPIGSGDAIPADAMETVLI